MIVINNSTNIQTHPHTKGIQRRKREMKNSKSSDIISLDAKTSPHKLNSPNIMAEIYIAVGWKKTDGGVTIEIPTQERGKRFMVNWYWIS